MPGRVENALLHVYEAEQSSPTDLRVSAMHDRSPLHTFLFDSQGFLLTANKAALQFCQAGSGQLTPPPFPQCPTVLAYQILHAMCLPLLTSAPLLTTSLAIKRLSNLCCQGGDIGTTAF